MSFPERASSSGRERLPTEDGSGREGPGPVREPENLKGFICMAGAVACLAVMHVLVRDIAREIHPFEVAFFRNLGTFLILVPLLLRQDRSAWRTKRPGLQVVRGVVGVSSMLTWFYALSLIPVADATALSFTTVLFTSLGAVFFLKEVMGPRRWAALALGFIGTFMILRPGFQEIGPGFVIVLISTALWAVALLVVKVLSRDDTSVTIVFYSSLYYTPISFLFALYDWQWPTWPQLGVLTVIAALAAVAHIGMAQALRLGEASAVMPADFTRLIWTAALGYLAFGEFPDLWTWAGGTVIFLSTLYITYREARQTATGR